MLNNYRLRIAVSKLTVFNQGWLGEKKFSRIMLVRNLVNEPGSVVHPETLEKIAFEIEKKSKGRVTVEILDEDECRNIGMGAFLGVAQGSEKKPKFIILHYQNGKSKIESRKEKKYV
jgi:leucyl aminopeptidase